MLRIDSSLDVYTHIYTHREQVLSATEVKCCNNIHAIGPQSYRHTHYIYYIVHVYIYHAHIVLLTYTWGNSATIYMRAHKHQRESPFALYLVMPIINIELSANLVCGAKRARAGCPRYRMTAKLMYTMTTYSSILGLARARIQSATMSFGDRHHRLYSFCKRFEFIKDAHSARVVLTHTHTHTQSELMRLNI